MTRVSAESRLQRLLVMVPWIMQQDGGASVDEVCERFDITEDQLASELEMLFVCGLYPFTPDSLIEADIVDGRVWIRSADQFQRPPRFTSQEALTLISAASAVADLGGNEENMTLKTALNKLTNALGLESDDAVEVALNPATPDVLEAVRSAAESHRVLEVDYYSYGRDAWNRRRIEPFRVFNRDGHWYVQARAQEVDQVRNFRVDRMRNGEVLASTFSPPKDLPEARTYQARDDDPSVILELTPTARWVLEQYPVEQFHETDSGNTLITMRISERLWLQRLLLRLGNTAKVIEGDVDISSSARQILRRYERQN